MRRLVCLFVALALFAPASAFAQQGTAEVRGTVMDAQQAPLPGVTVIVRNQDTGMFRETVATADGTYFISGIVPGRYEVTASLQGFSTFLRRDVVLEVGKTTSLDIPLAIGSVTESVTVVGETSLVDTTSKQVGGHITSRELLLLPSGRVNDFETT